MKGSNCNGKTTYIYLRPGFGEQQVFDRAGDVKDMVASVTPEFDVLVGVFFLRPQPGKENGKATLPVMQLLFDTEKEIQNALT